MVEPLGHDSPRGPIPAGDEPPEATLLKRRATGVEEPAIAVMAAAIAGAAGFAVSQPVYDLLGRNAAFFVAHQADGRDLLLFCLTLSLGLPLLLTLAVAALRALDRRLGRFALAAVLSICGALLALGLARSLDLAPGLAIVAAVTGGTLAALLGRRRMGIRALALLGAGGLLFPLLFLAQPDVRAVWEESEGAAETPPTPATRSIETPVVIVVFDELPTASLLTPEGELDAGRFPHFARLASTSSWYRQATTVSQATVYAVPAILTGNYPKALTRKSPTHKEYRPNVFTRLGDALPVNSWETMTRLCPKRLCKPPERWLIPRPRRLAGMLSDSAAVFLSLVAPTGWGSLPTLDDQWRDFWGAAGAPAPSEAPSTMAERRRRPDELFDWFLNTLEQHRREPALHYAHVMLPHRPWVWLPNGQRFASYLPYPHGLVNQRWRGSEWQTTQAQQRQLLTVGYVDTLVGRLMDTLERAGIFDETLLVITSDHGGSFRTNDLRRNLRREPTYEIVAVPLFIKYPAQKAGAIDDRNAETIDIVPTLLAVLGRASARLDGKDLRGPPNAKGDLKLTFLSGNKLATSGRALEYSAGGESGRQEALDAIARRFGTGSWDALFAAGPRPDLLGRRSSELAAGGDEDAGEAAVVDLDALAAVDPKAPVLPIHLYGSVSLRPAIRPPGQLPPSRLAVAVDGLIRSTTEVFESDEGTAFSSLLPPGSLRAGSNRLQILVIEGAGDDTTLRPLELVHRERGAA